MRQTCTRKLEFDSGHRLVNHEGKCAHPHGHRYVAEVTCEAQLDKIGRVIDFSVIKRHVGTWIDDHLDHAMIINRADANLLQLHVDEGWRHFVMDVNPTAENLAELIYQKAAELLRDYPIKVTHVRIYETPNCWADYEPS